MNMEKTTMKARKKIPMQIYLEPQQERMITLLAKNSGQAKAAIIRACITKFIEDLPLENDPALNIMSLGASGRHDIGERHDDYLTRHGKE